MKLFRKKNKPAPTGQPRTTSDQAGSIYSRNAAEVPLDGSTSASGPQHSRRTARSGAGRRRETSNRASDWAIAMLLLRTVLIVLLLAGGFFALKLFLPRLAGPSEKDKQRWEENARRMEKSGAAPVEMTPASQEKIVDAEMIREKLRRWEQADRHFRAADAFSFRGIDDQAIDQLTQALQSSPDNRQALQLLLDIYMKRNLFAEAVSLCIRLMDQNGLQKDLQMDLLAALQASGQMDAGMVLAEYILKDQPDNELVLTVVAAGKAALGDTAAALAVYEKILQINPQNKDALNGRGVICFNRGEYKKAETCFSDLIRIASEPEYYKALALAYAQQNLENNAVTCMGQAYSLFGGAEVSPWLRDSGFDSIRETADFRSFADRVVGAEARSAIEAISRREAEKTVAPQQLVLPEQPKLDLLRSNR